MSPAQLASTATYEGEEILDVSDRRAQNRPKKDRS